MPVSKATVNDVAALNLLVNTAYRGDASKRGWTTEAHLLDGNRIDEITLTEYLTAKGVTILKYTDDTNTIKACVYLQDKGEELYLGMLSVYPELQAGGIGRLLILEAEKLAIENGIPLITISVISTRTELIAWYIRRGFEHTGEPLPFHIEEKFGIPRGPIELITMKKRVL